MPPPNRQMREKSKPKNIRKTALRVLSYLANSRKKKLALVLVFFLVIVGSGATIVATFLLTPAINIGLLPYIGVPNALQSGKLNTFIGIVVIMGIVYLLGAASTYTYNAIMIRMAASAIYRIREDLFNAMEDLPLVYFDTHADGDVMSRYTNDVDALREALAMALPQLFTATLTITGTFLFMLILSWQLTILVFFMILLMVAVLRIVGSRSARGFKAQQKSLGIVNGYIEEMINGQKVVKIFNREDEVESEFNQLNEELRVNSTRANAYGNVLMPILGNLSYMQFALCSGIGGWLIIIHQMTLGALASFLQYSRTFSQPITQVSQLINTLLSALAGAERIFTLIDEEPEADDGFVTLVNIIEKPDGSVEEVDYETQKWAWKIPENGTYKYNPIHGDVEFNDVSFSYDGKREVLHDISLVAQPGEKIALVGSTGAGKTTITNLLNRFYEIDSGEIIYDGVNIKDIKKKDLRKSLAMVLQDTHLFTGTIADNIRFGKLNATQAEIEGAAELAHATHFINQLPDGFDTMITDDGENLSQGQRQLLAIARAAVANPPVLVLDEATSSIDTMTEKMIEKGMDALMADRTVFVIAHRLSTVRNADEILVLDQGEIIERGNHDELMEKQGRYYQLQTGQLELD